MTFFQIEKQWLNYLFLKNITKLCNVAIFLTGLAKFN